MVVDKEQNLWISMYKGGMDYYQTKTNRFKHFKHEENNNSLLYNNIRKVVLEGDSGLWIAYQHKKLAISFYSFKNKNFTHYDFTGEDKDDYLFDILRGKENQLWILSSEKLYLMDVKKRIIEKIVRKEPRFMNFFTFCLDDSGNLWIGTIGNGFIKYNPDISDFTCYNDILKYNISSVYSICKDDEGNIWLGTDNGLIRYHIASNAFSQYDKQDGVQGQVYYPLASLRGTNGNLYFGGTNGFTVVNPQQMGCNTYKPKIILTEFLIDNVSTGIRFSSNDSLKSQNRIVLNHNQINFGFKFSSDNYLIPEKNHFKYRLRGYDDRWVEVNASNRTALYSKVPPGDYYF
jgi:ligand-binding sensor domain-containing protein